MWAGVFTDKPVSLGKISILTGGRRAQVLPVPVGPVHLNCRASVDPRGNYYHLSSRFNKRASVHGRNTRNKNKLDIPAFHTAAGQRSFLYRAVKCWNTLPDEIIECKSLHSFESKAKSHFYAIFV